MRTLLLSATPYRMLTLQGDQAEDGDHYNDFLETLTFLFGQARGRDMVRSLDQEMRAFRTALHGLPAAQAEALDQKTKVEAALKRSCAAPSGFPALSTATPWSASRRRL